MVIVGGTLGGRLAPEDVLEHVAGSVVTPPARRGLSCTIYNALHTHSLYPRLLCFPSAPDSPGTLAAALQAPSSFLGQWEWTWFTTMIKIM